MAPIVMRSCVQYLSWMFIWPKQENNQKLYALKFVLLLCSSSFNLVGAVLHLFQYTRKEENADMTDDLLMIISQLGVLYFISLFAAYQNSISKVLDQLSDLESFGKPVNFDKDNKRLNKMSTILTIIVLSAITCSTFGNVIATGECERANRVKEIKDVCGLVVPIWLPFDFSKAPIKLAVLAWEAHCCFINYGGASIISIFILENMEHVVVRIRHLKHLLGELIAEPNEKTRRDLFGKWVRYHLFILQIGNGMHSSYRNGLFLHVIGTGVLFGFIGHMIMANKSVFIAVALFYGWFSSFCVVCVGGQRLMDEADSIGTAIYDSNWYQTDPKFQKNLIPVILQSRRSILIYAGPFTYVSHLLILTVLQTAFSYINLLKATS